jgi:hypothetical protein
VSNNALMTTMANDSRAFARLDAVPGLMPDGQREFMARQLVQQAQADYAAALARGEKADSQVRGARRAEECERQRADAAEAQVRHLERQLRELQPAIRKGLMPPTMPSSGSYELKWPWLAASWACLIAGVLVCAL